jgi:Carboxypeptidase regulatory-like domain
MMSFQKRMLLLIVVVASVYASFWRAEANAAQGRGTGWLKGKVIAPVDIGMADVSLKIKGERVQYDIRSDKQGSFQIELPAGSYQITATAGEFFPFRRSSVIVRPGEDIFVNVHLIPDPNLGDGEPIHILYDEIILPYSSLEPSNLLIAYAGSTRKADSVQYEATTLTYNALTIMADSIAFDRSLFRFFATGNVVVEDGKRQSRVRQAELIFTPKGPSLKTIQGIISAVEGKGTFDDATTFSFSANRKLAGYLSYEDKRRYLHFVSTRITAFDVIDEVSDKVKVLGTGFLNGILSVNFTLVVQKCLKETDDKLSIDFHINNISSSGRLATGKIVIHKEN